MRWAAWATAALLGVGNSEDPSTQLAQVRLELETKRREVAQLRQRLNRLDSARWLKEAEDLGVRDAVTRDDLTDRQQDRIAIAIVREAHANGLDPLLIVALIRAESSFDSFAVSSAGAMGLMQLTPGTAHWLAPKLGTRIGRKKNLFDSELNVQLGAAYLAQLLTRFGSLERALVAYNAGPAQARKILSQPAARARFVAGYPRQVSGEYRRLKLQQEFRLARREMGAAKEALAERAKAPDR